MLFICGIGELCLELSAQLKGTFMISVSEIGSLRISGLLDQLATRISKG